MKTLKWLVRREFWEHKGSIFWAPIIVGLLMIASIGGTVLFGTFTDKIINAEVEVDGQRTSVSNAIQSFPLEKRAELADAMASTFVAASAPLFLMLTVVVFFYCLGALHDERRERSILFWKSLPLSDQNTVLSKVITALVVAPVITVAVGTFTSVILLLIACTALAVQGVNIFGLVLSNPSFYLTPLQLMGLLPVYALWALPTVGWLLLVSAWARSKVFLWAVGAPLLGLAILTWGAYLLRIDLDLDWVAQHIVGRGLGSLIPGIWLGMEGIPPNLLVDSVKHSVDTNNVFTQSWLTLLGANVWLGALVGGAMIFAAMRLRRWKDEG
jgi:ABC-2 type transport system permease protein